MRWSPAQYAYVLGSEPKHTRVVYVDNISTLNADSCKNTSSFDKLMLIFILFIESILILNPRPVVWLHQHCLNLLLLSVQSDDIVIQLRFRLKNLPLYRCSTCLLLTNIGIV